MNQDKLREEVMPLVPSYDDFLSRKADSSPTARHPKHSELQEQRFPTYSEFISASHPRAARHSETTKIDDNSPIVPSFTEFILYAKPGPESRNISTNFPGFLEFLKYGNTSSRMVWPVETTAETPTPKGKVAKRTGVTLTILAAVLAVASMGVSVIASRQLEWFMFVGAFAAVALAITGERLNRRSKSPWFVNTVLLSVFSAVFPVLLVALGWLQLS